VRTRHKTLILAMSTALLTTPAFYAQASDLAKADSSNKTLANSSLALVLPGEVCGASGDAGFTGPTGPTGVTGTTCSGPVGDGDPVTFEFEVTGCEGVINDLDVGLDVTHPWIGDLVFNLTAPDSTTVTLIDQIAQPENAPPGSGCHGDDIFVVLDDDSPDAVHSACTPNTPSAAGTFSPDEHLSNFNGLAGNGTWQLSVSDVFPAERDGTLDQWSLDFDCGEAEPRATFEVNKVFADGNTADVDVTLNCFTGLPLTQTQTISESQNVTFIVTDFDDGELDCEVVEEPVNGYSAEYDNDATTSSESCAYEDIWWDATRICTITNTPDPVEVDVHKDWVIEGSSGDDLDVSYKLVLQCESEIIDGYAVDMFDWRKKLYEGSGNGISDADYSAEVIPNWDGGTECSVIETVADSSVEVSNDCEDLLVEIGSGDSCSIINTVFYEGIPTLSNYGLALLTLMMLGVGFVGFRRFA